MANDSRIKMTRKSEAQINSKIRALEGELEEAKEIDFDTASDYTKAGKLDTEEINPIEIKALKWVLKE